MKTQFTIILCLLFFSSYGQKTIELLDTNGNVKLLGPVDKKRLVEAPFSEWFNANYNEYTPEKKVLGSMKKGLKQIDSITIFFGTWCGDSRREVPRFVKILDEMSYDAYKLIGLDRTMLAYKRSPFGEELGLNVHRVPTFIFYRDSTEIGRIVEFPRNTLEEDMAAIVNSEEYEPNYYIVKMLDELIANKGSRFVIDHIDSLRSVYQPVSVKMGELNTYAFKLFSTFDLNSAKAAYLLNAQLFSDDYYPSYSLGRFYVIIGEYEKAKEVFEKGLKIDPENENLKKQLALLN